MAVSENTPHDALIGLDFPRCGRLSGDLEDELYSVVTAAVQTRAQKQREAQKEDEESEKDPQQPASIGGTPGSQWSPEGCTAGELGPTSHPASNTTGPSFQRSPKGCTAEELEEESDLEPEITNEQEGHSAQQWSSKDCTAVGRGSREPHNTLEDDIQHLQGSLRECTAAGRENSCQEDGEITDPFHSLGVVLPGAGSLREQTKRAESPHRTTISYGEEASKRSAGATARRPNLEGSMDDSRGEPRLA